jgi:hypothetical protein
MFRPDTTRLWCACAFLAVAFAGTPVGATTYLPITFHELIAEADVIFIGDVVDVRPYTLRTQTGTLVKTRVTFRVNDALYGTNSIVEVLDFLGGEADGLGMAVEGMPKFAVGDRRVVFARRKGSINPIVGFTQGLLRIGRDNTGVDRVFTLDALSGRREASQFPAMALTDFRTRVVTALAEAHKR